MRILHVVFRRYGPFEEQPLDFGDGAGLSVVFGPNESGKSSALRGLQSLLFGFAAQCGDDFLYPYKHFRIHARLADKAGRVLDCVRRKGNKETLRDAGDSKPVEEAALSEMLGSLDRSRFEQMFGLDAARLVEGGHEMVEGRGELGEALFAAGAGLKGLRSLARRIEAKAEELYLPSGKNQRLPGLLAEYREASAALKCCVLSPERYAAAERAAADANAEVESCELIWDYGPRGPVVPGRLLQFVNDLVDRPAIEKMGAEGRPVFAAAVHVADNRTLAPLVLRIVHEHHPLCAVLGNRGRVLAHFRSPCGRTISSAAADADSHESLLGLWSAAAPGSACLSTCAGSRTYRPSRFLPATSCSQ